MTLVVFLRGVNVGGYRSFRPSLLARALSKYDVVNVGAAGTFVVREPGPRAEFRAELLRKLPFEAEVVLCDGRDLVRFETENPFEAEPARADVVRFVSTVLGALVLGERFGSTELLGTGLALWEAHPHSFGGTASFGTRPPPFA